MSSSQSTSRQARRQQAGQAELTPEVRQALHRLLSYCWHDEARDYRSHSPSQRSGHVFEAMRLVKGWLEAMASEVKK